MVNFKIGDIVKRIACNSQTNSTDGFGMIGQIIRIN